VTGSSAAIRASLATFEAGKRSRKMRNWDRRDWDMKFLSRDREICQRYCANFRHD
jgi:hypothetical protein